MNQFRAAEALEDAIQRLAKQSATASQGSEALKYAMAANALAEARAWLDETAQTHGGQNWSEGAR